MEIAMELHFDRKQNLQERLWFVHQYAQWVKQMPNQVWSKQQAQLVNSFYKNAQNFSLSKSSKSSYFWPVPK